MKYLGIDYGKRKVGLAKSEGKLAEPFRVVEVSGLTDAVAKVAGLAEEEGIEVVVCGVAESGEARNMARAFIRGLKERGLRVVSGDETLSTHLAGKQIRELGLSKDREDALAASVILQNYLDRLK